MENHTSHKVRYMVCNDGSEASTDALQTIYHGLLREKDEMYVSLAWSLYKEEYLPYNQKKDYIKNMAISSCAALGKRFHWVEHELKEGQVAKEVLVTLAEDNHIDVMVVGFHGRKGPKADPTVMGSAVQYMSIQCKKPVLVIKDPHKRAERPNGYNLAVCVDGSDHSIRALDMLCDLCGDKDKIVIIVCEQSNIDVKKVTDKIDFHLEEKNCHHLNKSTIKVLPAETGRKPCDIIREYLLAHVAEEYIDFILVGNKGADFSDKNTEKYIGSVANAILRNTKINCLFFP
jgi:nucleotide-binding universal stress UspA family protein